MIIGGFQKFSLIDYPGKISCIVFTQGCNFRCPYCHNPELIPFTPLVKIKEETILSFLEKRKGKIDAVVITGGEPTMQQDLLKFIQKIKEMGYLTKLDTNGSNPEMLEIIINHSLVDYIAMDIKAPLEKYKEVTHSVISPEEIKRSIRMIMNSDIKYEFRTTVVKSQLSKEDIINIGKLIEGAELYILQKFIPSKTLDPNFLNKKTYSDGEFKELKKDLEKLVCKCLVR